MSWRRYMFTEVRKQGRIWSPACCACLEGLLAVPDEGQIGYGRSAARDWPTIRAS